MSSYKITYSSELYHHGILGQKWGKRNGPPYPLDSEDHSTSEKKAGWKKSLDSGGRNHFSVKAAGHKAMAKVYELNERAYKKNNKTLSSINAQAKNEQLRKAQEAQDETNRRHEYRSAGRSIKTGSMSSEEKGKIAKIVGAGALVAGTTALAIYAAQNPEFREKVKNNLATSAKKIGDATVKTLSKAGEAAANAAMASAGSLAIVKLSDKMTPAEADTESERNTKQIALDAATAAIRTATNANSVPQQNKSNSDGKIGKEVSEKLGPPSNKGIDKNSREYQSLFKDIALSNLTSDSKEATRATVKSLANAGYDIDQIQQYLNSVVHSYYGMFRIIRNDELYHFDRACNWRVIRNG